MSCSSPPGLWKILTVRVPGSSHREVGRGTDDRVSVRQLATSRGHNLVLAVSDGAGSASHGGDGAAIAVQHFVEHYVGHRQSTEVSAEESRHFAFTATSHARMGLEEHAQENLGTLRPYACTIIGVAVSQDMLTVAQIGDGAAVFAVGDQIQCARTGARGEYINETFFLTGSDWHQRLRTQTFELRADWVAVFTDGVEQLAIESATGTPTAGFFDPIVRALEEADDDEMESIEAAVERLFTSQRVTTRTDDDLTLVIAIRASDDTPERDPHGGPPAG